MWAFIKLQVRENSKKAGFFIFAIIGFLVTLIVLFGGEFSVNGGVSSEYSQFGFQWTFLTAIACLATVTLSMGVLARFRQSGQGEILRLHGLEDRDQDRGIFVGNALVSLIMGLVLVLGMVFNIVLKGPSFPLGGFFLAIFVYLFTILLASLLMTLLSLFLPPAVASLFGVFAVIIGSLQGILSLVTSNMGGLFGQGMGLVLQVFPPIQGLSQLERDLFFGEALSLKLVFQAGIYFWVLLGLIYFGIEWGIKNEK